MALATGGPRVPLPVRVGNVQSVMSVQSSSVLGQLCIDCDGPAKLPPAGAGFGNTG